MTKKMILPTDPKERKSIPFVTGLIDYFPLALAEVAKTSYAGQQQHNPDKPLAWDKEKSKDHHDCIGRHLVDRGTFDTDGVRHSAKLAWRALAALQIELEEAQKEEGSPNNCVLNEAGKPLKELTDSDIEKIVLKVVNDVLNKQNSTGCKTTCSGKSECTKGDCVTSGDPIVDKHFFAGEWKGKK